MWYYNKNNKQEGPVDESAIGGMISSGAVTINTPVWTAGMSGWLPLKDTPLAKAFPSDLPPPITPPPLQQAAQKNLRGEVFGYMIVGIPVLAAVGMLMQGHQSESSTLTLKAVILVTAVMVFIDARILGVGSAGDLNAKGKARTGPGAWLVGTILFWIVGYPGYLNARARRGVTNLLIPGVIVMFLLLGVYAYVLQP